jgi:hypothetical protein
MSEALDRDGLRATLAGFDDRKKRIVGGLTAVMFKNPERVREREWITEQLTEVTLLAGEFEDVPSVDGGVDVVQGYLAENTDELLNACYLLFLAVGDDLAPRVAEGVTHTDAMVAALGYFG